MIFDSATTFLALPRHSPIVRICSATPSSPSATIFAGVLAALNRPLVALFTDTSVACADSATATTSVKGSL
jgi:hypothetical protein